MENKEHSKFERAQRRVARIRSFYNHVGVFVIINAMLLLSKDKMAVAFFGEETLGNPKMMSWVDWNIYIWAVILIVHALLVFGNIPYFVKNWEERQLERFIKEEQEDEKYE